MSVIDTKSYISALTTFTSFVHVSIYSSMCLHHVYY